MLACVQSIAFKPEVRNNIMGVANAMYNQLDVLAANQLGDSEEPVNQGIDIQAECELSFSSTSSASRAKLTCSQSYQQHNLYFRFRFPIRPLPNLNSAQRRPSRLVKLLSLPIHHHPRYPYRLSLLLCRKHRPQHLYRPRCSPLRQRCGIYISVRQCRTQRG